MAIEVTGKQFEESATFPCVCGKKGTVKFSQIGVCAPNGWWVAMATDSIAQKAFLAVACSPKCLTEARTKREAANNAKLAAQAAGIEVVEPGGAKR